LSLSDWLSDIPIIGDVWEVSAEAFAALLADSYSELRENMSWVEVDSTGLDTRNHLLAETSLDPVQLNKSETEIISGKWEDITGFVSTDPQDFDIDHRVPFRKVVEMHTDFDKLEREEQLAIYNDRDNLQVLRDRENLIKSDMSHFDYAHRIKDPEVREKFLASAESYIEKIQREKERL